MKHVALFVILIAFASGCHHGMFQQVAGSGNRQKQTREVGSFTGISTEGAFEIEINSQEPLSLEIEGDDNILPLISTEVSNNVLHIKGRKGYSVSEPIRLKIRVPNLEGISSSGAGSIEVKGLKNEKFQIEVNGAATIRASGQTGLVTIKSNGAGKIDTHKLRATRAVVNSNGVAKVDVHAADELDVSVSGPSTVTYEGNPVVKKSVNGPGNVQKKASEGS